MNRRSFLDLGARASALAVLPRVAASSTAGSLSAASSAAWNLSIHTDPTMWSAISAHTRPGDLYRSFFPNLTIPWSMRSWGFPNDAALVAAGDQKLARFCAVHLDGEYADFQQGVTEAPQIRAFVNADNLRHPTLKLTFEAYFHTPLIDAHPTIVPYPDNTSIGASRWQQSPLGIQTHAKPYVDLIRAAGRAPAVRLTDYLSPHGSSRVNLTASQLAAQIQAVVNPAPSGLAVSRVEGFNFFTAPSTPWPAAVIAARG